MNNLMKLVTTFLMFMSAAGSPLESLFKFQQDISVGKHLKQMFSMDVNKKVLNENNNIYTTSASMTQIQTFSELTGIEIPFSSQLNMDLLFKVQETITPSGCSFMGRISLDTPLDSWDYLSIPFTGELTENSFTLEAEGKTLEVNWKEEDEAQWYNELFIEFKDPSSRKEVQVRANLIPDTSEVKIVLLNNQEEQGTMTVSKTGKVRTEFRSNQKIYDTIDKYFLFFGKMWFGEGCTLERAREAVMLMFGWSCGSCGSGCSIYPEGLGWFQFKIPDFLVPK